MFSDALSFETWFYRLLEHENTDIRDMIFGGYRLLEHGFTVFRDMFNDVTY